MVLSMIRRRSSRGSEDNMIRDEEVRKDMRKKVCREGGNEGPK
jgi:hypothetical protein